MDQSNKIVETTSFENQKLTSEIALLFEKSELFNKENKDNNYNNYNINININYNKLTI